MTVCAVCGFGGERRLVAGLTVHRHYRPSDHRFIPVADLPVMRPGWWDRVDRSAGPLGCWPWLGPRNVKGYGRSGHQELAHRAVLTSVIGRAMTRAELACHRCDNPPCCNPAHLFVGSASDNQRDRWEKGRGSLIAKPRTHCVHGHELTGDNVRIYPGGRHCRTCDRERSKAVYATPEGRAQSAASSRRYYWRQRALVVETRSADQAVPPEPHLASIPVEVPGLRFPAQQPD